MVVDEGKNLTQFLLFTSELFLRGNYGFFKERVVQIEPDKIKNELLCLFLVLGAGLLPGFSQLLFGSPLSAHAVI